VHFHLQQAGLDVAGMVQVELDLALLGMDGGAGLVVEADHQRLSAGEARHPACGRLQERLAAAHR